MLTTDSIHKSFPTRAGELVVLRGVTFSIRRGQSAAILGPSGSGKSTLLNILGALDHPTSGHVRLEDSDPFVLRERELARFRNRKVGFVFQDHHLLPQCSALENVLLPTLAGGTDRAAEGRARGLLQKLGLAERLEHLPAELSGGERQRVAIARALINQPRLVLADEPSGNLDQSTAERIGALLAELPREHDVILVAVTHSETLAQCFDQRYQLTDGILTPR